MALVLGLTLLGAVSFVLMIGPEALVVDSTHGHKSQYSRSKQAIRLQEPKRFENDRLPIEPTSKPVATGSGQHA
jgi:hypothetical protein